MKGRALQIDFTLVTHQGLPQGAQDDQLLAEALLRRGCTVRFAVWNDPSVDWSASSLTLVRSNWDYHLMPQAWLAWIESVGSQTRLLNPPALLRWNTDKRYLAELAAKGQPCLPTVFVEDAALSPQAIASANGWQDVVIKPAIGASARGARRFRGTEIGDAAEQHLRLLLQDSAVLVQPYMAVVERAQERCLVFIAGRFSHAFVKPAFSSGAAGHLAIQLHQPSLKELAVAEQVLRAAPMAPTYARVDLISGEHGPMLMELELIEPDMALRLAPTGVASLVTALT